MLFIVLLFNSMPLCTLYILHDISLCNPWRSPRVFHCTFLFLYFDSTDLSFLLFSFSIVYLFALCIYYMLFTLCIPWHSPRVLIVHFISLLLNVHISFYFQTFTLYAIHPITCIVILV